MTKLSARSELESNIAATMAALENPEYANQLNQFDSIQEMVRRRWFIVPVFIVNTVDWLKNRGPQKPS